MTEREEYSITVVMPIYNGSNYLSRCLNSIIHQSFACFEVVCIDDGSIDATGDILREYEKMDSRIRVITIPHSNSGEARNIGLQAARGKYIAFVDVDDFLEPHALQTAFERAEAEEADICLFTYDDYDEHTGAYMPAPLALRTREMPENRPFSAEDAQAKIFNLGSYTPCDKLYRREFIEKNNLSFQSIPASTDLYFVMSAFACANSISVLEEVLLHHRINGYKVLSCGVEHHWMNAYKALMSLKEYLVTTKKYEMFQQSFVNLAMDFSIGSIFAFGEDLGGLMRNLFCRRGFAELDIVGHEDSYYYPNRIEELHRLINEYELDVERISNQHDEVITVIVPSYEADNTNNLALCLQSILCQIYEKLEIFVLDDGADSDRTELLKKFAKQDNRIKLKSLEKPFRRVKGNYITIISPNDFVYANYIELLVNTTSMSENVDMVCMGITEFVHNKEGFIDVVRLERPIMRELYGVPFDPSDQEDFIAMTNEYAGILFSSKLFKEIAASDYSVKNGMIGVVDMSLHYMLSAAENVICLEKSLYMRRICCSDILSDMPSGFLIETYKEALECTLESDNIVMYRQLVDKIVMTHMEKLKTLVGKRQRSYVLQTAEVFTEIKKDTRFKEVYVRSEYLSDFNRIIYDPLGFYYFVKQDDMQVSFVLTEEQLQGDLYGLLESLRRQGLTRYEILLAPTGAVCEDLARDLINIDTNCILLDTMGMTFSKSLERTISAARGDYIYFPNTHEYFGDNVLGKVYQYAVCFNSDICMINGFGMKMDQFPREDYFSIQAKDLYTKEELTFIFGKLFNKNFLNYTDFSQNEDACYRSNSFAEKCILNTDGISISDLVAYSYNDTNEKCGIVPMPFIGDSTIVVRYFKDENKAALSYYTLFEFGNPTKMRTLQELGFEDGRRFVGWKIFRKKDNSWYVENKDGKRSWTRLVNSALPKGSEFVMYNDNVILSKPSNGGEIHLIACWE